MRVMTSYEISATGGDIKLWSLLLGKALDCVASDLSQKMGKQVKFHSLKLRKASVRDVSDALGGVGAIAIGIYSSYSGDSSGRLLLAFKPELICMLAGEMTQSGQMAGVDLQRTETSALEEVCGVINSSFLSAVADYAGKRLCSLPPTILIDSTVAIMDIALSEILEDLRRVFVVDTFAVYNDYEDECTFVVVPSVAFVELVTGS